MNEEKPLWFEEYEKRIDQRFNSMEEKIVFFIRRCDKCPVVPRADKLEEKINTLQVVYGAGIALLTLLTLVLPYLLPKIFG